MVSIFLVQLPFYNNQFTRVFTFVAHVFTILKLNLNFVIRHAYNKRWLACICW